MKKKLRHKTLFFFFDILKRKDVITMVCATIKPGVDCFFMNKKGCQFNGGSCHPVVEQCNGCQKAKEFPAGTYCLIFPDPAIKWRSGSCNMATHLSKAGNSPAQGKINPLKASKRGAR